ncbi:uncharacterized protein EKO05_0008912 [Ascochyta rabiei]|uniref:uncharacterized protein n=1 Tax=Didymella rabiei TaxID=5454 RepID=UPI0022093150|nr:uncharacterized protein EKO05_0008912 [Ascochyta rabiei]UPX18618.1 hypothetical protein EKO05_0008912 [Ascochyta rabiei]
MRQVQARCWAMICPRILSGITRLTMIRQIPLIFLGICNYIALSRFHDRCIPFDYSHPVLVGLFPRNSCSLPSNHANSLMAPGLWSACVDDYRQSERGPPPYH